MTTYERPAIWDVLYKGRPYKPFAWQAEHLHSKVDAGFRTIVLPCGRRSGKALRVDEPIATPDGWKPMGALVVGDYVFAVDGSPTRVVDVTRWGLRPTYRVSFSDGTAIYADEQHEWVLERKPYRPPYTDKIVTKTTGDLARLTLSGSKRSRDCYFKVPRRLSLGLPDSELPIHPYLLGVWLGDGHSDTGRITSADPEVIDRIRDLGYEVRRTESGNYLYRVVGLTKALRAAGVLCNKHIPVAYLRSSDSQRLDLLRGLMDTDGSVQVGNEFYTTKPDLRDGVLELVRTLGWNPHFSEKRAKLWGKDCGPVWTISFQADRYVFNLPRKMARQSLSRPRRVGVMSVERVDDAETVCITIEHESHLFLAGESMKPTHNSTGVVAEVAREVIQPPVEVMGMTHAPIVYVIGPTAETSMRVFQPVWDAFVPSDNGSYVPPLGFLYAGHDKNRGVIFTQGGGQIFRKTADDPRSLQGERVTLAIPDESQDINEDAWENLLPALSDSDGRMICIGVPKGKGRFRSLYFAGQGADPSIYSASVPTTANPIYVQRAMKAGLDPIDYIRQQPWASQLTDAEFERQYLAKWTDEDGEVFARFEHLFTAPGKDVPEAGHTYFMGLDLGKLHDFTVAYVGDLQTGEFVAVERFNKVDYVDQVPRLASLAKHWGVQSVVMDVTGVGQAPYEMLVREGISISPYVFTNQSKQALVSTMVREVERGNVRFLAGDEVLKREMSLFEGTVSPGGVIKYEAPKGYFDDCVVSAAMLIWKMARNRPSVNPPRPQNYVSFHGQERRRRHMTAIQQRRERTAA